MISLLLSPRFGACTAGVHPFRLAMQHFYSFVSQMVSILLSPSLLVGHCVRLVSLLSPSPSCLPSCLTPFWSLCPPCLPLVSLLFSFVSGFVSLLVGHCVRGHSSPELETNKKDCKAEADTAGQSWVTNGIAKDCKADTAAERDVTEQSRATANVKDCKAEADRAVQSWETHGKDCEAQVDTAVQSWGAHVKDSCWSLCPPCLPSVSLRLRSCLPSCWSLCPPCLPSVSFCFPLSPVLSPFLLVTVSGLSPFCLPLLPFLSPSCLRQTQQPRAGRQKDCKAEVGAAQQEGGQEGRQKETEGRQGGHSDQQEGRQDRRRRETEGRQKGDRRETEGRQKGDKEDTMTDKNPFHVPPSSGLRCPPVPRNPFHAMRLPALGCFVRLCLAILHISSGLLCPPLACSPLHLSQLLYPPCNPLQSRLSPSSGLLCPPLPCNPNICLPAVGTRVSLCLHLSPSSGLLCPP